MTFKTCLLWYTFSALYCFYAVGSGPSGSAVATRLSETGASVLLLEAGSDIEHISLIPSLGSYLVTNPDRVWNYDVKPQDNAMLGFKNQVRIDNLKKWVNVINPFNYM